MFKWREGQQEAIHHTNLKRGITSSFARALKVLQQKHVQCKEDEFVYSNDGSNNLCSSLESAFLHGLKDSVAHKLTAYVGLTAAPDQISNMNFWSVVVKFTHSDVVTQLLKLTQINTEIGLCRAWVRLALNDGLMESYLHSMIVDTKTLQYFYHSYAYLRDHEQPGILKNYLTGLMSLEFKLSYNSSVLNSWNNVTLQLAGALDPHSAPAPAIGQAHAGLDTRQQKNSPTNKTKRDEPSAIARNAGTISRIVNSSVVVSTENVDILQNAYVCKGDNSSCQSLSVSEGSSSSHVSCPDPDIGALREAKITHLKTKDDVDSISEKVSFLVLTDVHDLSREQGDWADSPDMKKTEVCLSGDKTENSLKSPVILQEANHIDAAASPGRPRSRNVDEEDIKVLSSSSLSPSSPKTSAGNDGTQCSEIVYSNENKSFVNSASFIVHPDFSKKRDTSQERSEGLNYATKKELVYQGTMKRQSYKSNDELRPSIYDGLSSTTFSDKHEQQKASTRKSQIDEVSEAVKQEGKDNHNSGSNSSVFITQDTHDKISQENSDKLQRFSEICETNSTALGSSEMSRKSLLVSTTTDNRQPVLHPENEDRGSTRLECDHHGSDGEQSNSFDKKKSAKYDHSYGPFRVVQDLQTGEHADLSSHRALHSNESSKQDAETLEADIEMSVSPSRFGNSLSNMSGWSSEIESKRERRKQLGMERSRGESFATMLRGYTPAQSQQSHSVTLNEVIEALPCEGCDDNQDGSQQSQDAQDAEDNQQEDLGLDNFEVLKSPSEFFCGQVEANILTHSLPRTTASSKNQKSSRMFFLFHVPREHGLSHQNFTCKGCSRPIGIIYGPSRLCEFDGGLYCFGCHENNETYIPSSILFDWDFRKKKVCQENYKFLQDLEDQALYDVEELNPKLYNHVPELQDLKTMRQQLVYLKSYLFACSQKVTESMRQKVWPREHIYEKRDLYSVMDFLQVQSGSLQKLVKDLVKFSSQHVYDCNLCSLKGFVCEICRNPQVIYPFEVDTTVRCATCKAVYHKTCMTESLPCPKCERWGRHISSSNINNGHPEDYGLSPHT